MIFTDVIRREVGGFSKLFKIAFFCLLAIYAGCWLFTISLSFVQRNLGIEPLLPVLGKDSAEYADLSESLLRGEGFTQYGRPETLRAPGYPAFVAFAKLIGGTYFFVTLVQVILVFFSALIIRRLGILFSRIAAGEIAAFLILVNPITLSISLSILTDILFFFVLLLAVYLTLSLKEEDTAKRQFLKIYISSLLFGFAIYIRPMGVFALPIFIAPFIVSNLYWKRKIAYIGAMLLIVAASLSPWIARNYSIFGVADFTSFKAFNLAYYAVPIFLSHKHGTSPQEERKIVEKETNVPIGEWRNLEHSPLLSRFTQKVISDNFFPYLAFHLESSLPFFFSSSLQDFMITYKGALNQRVPFEPGAIQYLLKKQWGMFFGSITAIWWKIAERLVLLFIYAVALIGFWINRKNPLTWMFVFIPAYFMFLAGPAANVRYALQAYPFVFILFGTGFFTFVERIKSKKIK